MEEAKRNCEGQICCGIRGAYMVRHIPGETPPNYGRGQLGCRCISKQIFHPNGYGLQSMGIRGGVSLIFLEMAERVLF